MPQAHNKAVQGQYSHNEEWGNRKTIGFLDTKTTGKWYRASGFPQISGPTQSTPLPSLSLYIRDPIIPLLHQAHILLITVLFATYSLQFFASIFKSKQQCCEDWKMSSTRKVIVAVSVGVVEAMKDQGICRWNFIMRSVQQHAKNHLRSISQTRNLSSSTSAMVSSKLKDDKMKQSEESLRKVMYLSCWGPN